MSATDTDTSGPDRDTFNKFRYEPKWVRVPTPLTNIELMKRILPTPIQCEITLSTGTTDSEMTLAGYSSDDTEKEQGEP